MNRRSRVLTDSEYKLIVNTIKQGYTLSDGKKVKSNIRVATALTLQANLGLRIGDVCALTLDSFVRDGNRYRLNIVEQKTKKTRMFSVPDGVYLFVQSYVIDRGINPHAFLFNMSVRAVQKSLSQAVQHLGFVGISTHSFRKFFATSIYNDNQYNIELVRALLQHSSIITTQRYIGIQQQVIEDALAKHIVIPG